MPVADFQSLMLPVLRGVADDDISAADLRNRIAVELRLTEADLAEMLPSGRQTTFANRTAWANVFLQRAGLLEKVSRGVYRINSEGRHALAEHPERIDMRFLERYPAYVEWRQRSVGAKPTAHGQGAGSATEDQTPEEQIEASHTALPNSLQDDLLERVREMSPAFFERLIVDLLIAMGYGGGRAEMGQAIGRAGVGRISKRIILIDGAELAALMVRNNVGVRIRTVYEVKKIDEDYFSEQRRRGVRHAQGHRSIVN